MSIVTRGLGGRSLISKGFGWLEILKEIVRKIARFLPYKRKKFLMKVRVYGEVSHPFEMKIPIKGERDIFKQLWLVLEDEEDD